MAKKDVKPKMLIVERTEEEYELYRKMFSGKLNFYCQWFVIEDYIGFIKTFL